MKPFLPKKSFVFVLSIFSVLCIFKTPISEPLYGYPDLRFSINDDISSEVIANKIFIPKFNSGIAVALLPGCTGIQRWNKKDLISWRDFFIEKGFVVGIADYNSSPRPNGKPYNCGKNKNLEDMRLVKDVYDTTSALAKVKGVDINKIFTVGFSLGAQIGADAIRDINAEEAKTHNWGPLPRGVISLYGGCAYPSRTYLDENIVRPVLWMMGEDDNYYMEGCETSTFESIKEQFPHSEFISFEKAGHCWDCKQLDGFHNRREGHIYRYNAKVHKESETAALKFIEKFE